MGEVLRKLRRKGTHKKLEAENIELRKALAGMQSAVGQLHMTMLRFALGSNWACVEGGRWKLFWKRPVPPEYVWVGAGNPEKAANDVMVACFGKDYRAQAAAALAAMKKKQEEKDVEVSKQYPPGDPAGPNAVGRGE